MSKKKRRRRAQVHTKQQDRLSFVIPIVVAVIVVAIVIGAILSIEGGQSASAERPGQGVSQASTAQPLATGSLPYPEVPRISVEEAQAKLEQQQAILVDVRSRASYDQAHAVGAISVPEDEVAARLNELPRDQVMILYCT